MRFPFKALYLTTKLIPPVTWRERVSGEAGRGLILSEWDRAAFPLYPHQTVNKQSNLCHMHRMMNTWVGLPPRCGIMLGCLYADAWENVYSCKCQTTRVFESSRLKRDWIKCGFPTLGSKVGDALFIKVLTRYGTLINGPCFIGLPFPSFCNHSLDYKVRKYKNFWGIAATTTLLCL